MLRVTVELVPDAGEEFAEVLQTTYIVNDLTSKGPEFGNYVVLADDTEPESAFAHIYRHVRYQDGALATLAYRALALRASLLKEKVPHG